MNAVPGRAVGSVASVPSGGCAARMPLTGRWSHGPCTDKGHVMHKRTAAVVVVVVLGFLVFAGCGDDDDDAGGDEGGGASVSVVLTDPFGLAGTPGQFAVEPDPISVDAGSLEIVAKNQGGDLHELVIVKGDDPTALPTDEYGAVIEDDLPEGDFIGEIALVDAGTEESASFDLDAGSYILFCNIVTATAPPSSHFEDGDGMVNTLTVT